MATFTLAPLLFAATLIAALAGALSMLGISLTAGLLLGLLAAAGVAAAVAWQLRMACLTARWNAGRRLR
ncbi:hypothetical protein [Ramlibacter humi]|uniref:Uncharacterized protein n=1 Tax=Ramlibacter humi TaxID=2530451 RepID=A0A4Z0BYJ9_9BURK|nr:hypothetical protein [Ramlibacter humi]TFZ03594.1 hypothetical protein EZ216_07955 [Ramlibacter humi]